MMIIVSTCRLLDFPLKVADFWRQSSEEFLSAVTCLNVQHRRQNQIIQNLHICLRLGSHKAWTLAITSAVTLSASIPNQDGDDKGDDKLIMITILIKMVMIRGDNQLIMEIILVKVVIIGCDDQLIMIIVLVNMVMIRVIIN